MKRLIGAEIRGLQNLIARQLDGLTSTLGEDFLSGQNLFILKYLMENEEKDVFQCDLEKVLSVTKSTCSKVLTTMQQKGLIERSGVSDARYKKISITEKGKNLIEKFDKFIYAHDESLVKGLTDEQIRTFLYCIDTIKSNIQNK